MSSGENWRFEMARRDAPEEISDNDPLETQRGEINSAIGAWFDKRGALGTIQEWTERLLWASRAPASIAHSTRGDGSGRQWNA